MKIRNQHERMIAAPPGEVAALIADFDRVWPAQIGPAPRPQADGTYLAGLMVWAEVDRPGAVRAFRVVRPEELQAEHWFEVAPAGGGTVLRHTVEGSATGTFEAVWRDRIAPVHDRTLEALLDNVEAAAGPGRLSS
ncbi:MAG TPA: SRPBCC family protein [Streptosporangiaceae bacterium]|nr:SRPBCC family protein [Streptosporangiaceae bacterium]